MKRILLLPFLLFFLFSVAISFSQDVQQESNSDKKEVKKYDAEASKRLLSSSKLSLDEIKKLVEHGANVNAVTDGNNTVLHNYISANDPEILKYLIEQGANVNARNVSGFTPLDRAVKKNTAIGNPAHAQHDPKKTTEIIKILVDNGADIFANNLSTNPINSYLRRYNGIGVDLDLVKSLLNKNNINMQDQNGRTPLHCVILSRPTTLEVLKYICEDCKADVNLPDNSGVTPIHCAVTSLNIAVVTLLLEKGADINAVDKSGKSALKNMIENTHASKKNILKEIITKNKINITDIYKGVDSPLHIGVKQGMSFSRIRCFIEIGIPINSRNELNQTPLHFAATSPKHEQLVQLLLDNSADINAEDDSGKTPLHYAAAAAIDTTNIIKILLDKKANVNAKDKNNQTPLSEILKSKKPTGIKFTLVKLLVEKKADVNIKDKDLSTPLHIIMSFAPLEGNLIRYLIEQGVDINAQDNNGQTALTILLEQASPQKQEPIYSGSCYSILKIFIEHGADVSIKDKNNTTIFETIIKINLQIEPPVLKKLIANGKNIDWSKCTDTSPVCWALSNGAELEVLEYFSKGKADFMMKDKNSNLTPLAAFFHYYENRKNKINFETMKFLIERGANVNDRLPPFQQTPLLFVLSRGIPDFEIVKYLVDKGADTHAEDKRGFGALHTAIMLRTYYKMQTADNYDLVIIDIVKYLVEHEADVNLPDNIDSARPIHLAALMGAEQIVRYLAEQKVKLNVKTPSGATPLHYALRGFAKIDLVKFLVQNGCSVNDKNSDGKTPLHEAVANKQISLDIVKYLCEDAHAEINVKDKKNNTPLLSAVRYPRKFEIIKYLIERGVDIHAVDIDGRNAIHYLTTAHYLPEPSPLIQHYYNKPPTNEPMNLKSMDNLISIFIDNGVNINCKDKRGKTPLHCAVDPNSTINTNLVALFIKKGADIYAKDNNGRTALFLFLLYGNKTREVLKIFDVNSNKEKYETFLHEFIIAANNINGSDIATRVEAIIKAGVPVNTKDKFGSTPLHVAVGRNLSLQVVQCLINNGADTNAKDNNNATPLHYAAEYCSIPEVLDALIKAGADVNAKDIFGMTPLDLLGTENRSAKETILQNKIRQKKRVNTYSL
ncbi:MAG: ankyrin repeat domain-containing protein [Planctomycetaceae bacterium]|jgi:ankyrin repeat protein|nr:ankyrin repeat domain-containing protein [Planctomycetaceae bacterium]